MTDVDPAKLVAALRKAMTTVEALSRKVGFLEEQNAKSVRTGEELAQHLTRLRSKMDEESARIDGEVLAGLTTLIHDQEAENERLRIRLDEQEKDVSYLQSYAAGHEAALIGLTGQSTTLVFWDDNPTEPENG